MMVEFNDGGAGESGRNNIPGGASDGANKKHKAVPRMAPILSRRSIIALTIGLLLGVGLGIAYWALSPTISNTISDIKLLPTKNISSDGPHESTINIQIVNPGASFMYLSDLRRMGEYYAAKATTYPFFEFLSQELDKQAPEYAHTADELSTMLQVRYDYDTELPTIEMAVSGSSDVEAFFLAGFAVEIFQDYLLEEERLLQLEEYNRIAELVDSTREALVEAEGELHILELAEATYHLNSDPTYIMLSATTAALEIQLGEQTAILAKLIAIGEIDQNYIDAVATIETISIALGETRNELAILQAQDAADHMLENMDYLTAQSKVDELIRDLSGLSEMLAASVSQSTGEDITNNLIAGQPSTPVPILPERILGRNAAMIGGIVGVGVAWVFVNRKWVFNGLSSTQTTTYKTDEEDEA